MAGKIIADIIEAPYDSIKMNVGNVTVLTANSSGLNYIPTGNVNINIGGPTANLTMNLLTANGIKFPATQVSSADANTLDDYEEGTWTPTITGASSNPTVSYSEQTGHYTKIGKVVYIRFRLTFSFSGGSGSVQVSGLPFTAANHTQPRTAIQQDYVTYTGFTYLEIGVNGNTTTMGLGKNRSGSTAAGVDISDLRTAGTDINGGIFYFV